MAAARAHDPVEWNLAPNGRDGNVFHPHLYSELEKMNECDMCTGKEESALIAFELIQGILIAKFFSTSHAQQTCLL